MADKDIKVADHAKSEKPSSKQVTDFHTNSDADGSPKAQHHTLGPNPNQAASGNHTHDGGSSARLTELLADITVTGATADAALRSLLDQLESNFGLVDLSTF